MSNIPDLGEALASMAVEAIRPFEHGPHTIPSMAVVAVLHINAEKREANWKLLYSSFHDFKESPTSMLKLLATDIEEKAGEDTTTPPTHLS